MMLILITFSITLVTNVISAERAFRQKQIGHAMISVFAVGFSIGALVAFFILK
jgi:hypothetical protein